jgi:1-acyl-sn-glycerol-3-phosphate acyltransferase
MQHTVFETPVVRPALRSISLACLKISGWRVEGRLPDIPKYIIIAAFHTSNWDFVIGLFAAFVLKAKAYWIGKDNLFRPPFDSFFHWIGGIPINRRQSQNMVSQIIKVFQEHESQEHERLTVAMAPEGTRGKAPYWKTGFYHIALGARIPVVLAFIDYRRKACGIGPVMIPTGNIEADMRKISAYYANVTGKYPEKMSPPAIKPASLKKTGS